MFNNNFEFKINNTQKDTEGNLIALDISIEDQKVVKTERRHSVTFQSPFTRLPMLLLFKSISCGPN